MPMMPAKLNAILAISYVANTVITFGSNLGWFGATNPQQSLKYQTLVTPAGFAFAIWGPIFFLQGAFAVALLLPMFRAAPEVTEGVSYWYVAVVVAQAGWTVAFAQDVIWLSQICMCLIVASLGLLCRSLTRVARTHPPNALRYTLWFAPFLVHFGWVSAACFVNLNVVLVKYAPHAHTLHLGAAVASLALLLLPALYNPLTTNAAAPSADTLYTGPIAWALFGVGRELGKQPLEGGLAAWCPPLVSGALAGVALGLAALLGGVALARLALTARRACRGVQPQPQVPFLSCEERADGK